MTKRMLSFLLVLVLVIGMIPVTHVHAENIEETMTEQTAAPTEEETTWETEPAVQAEAVEVLPIAGETNLADLDLPDSDELFAGFVEKQFYEQILSENSIPATFGTAAGARLTGNDKIVYDAFASVFQQLADGTRTDATISLGQTVLHDGVTYVPDVEATFTGMTINLRNIIVALITDLPYECYWFDKTSGWKPFGLTSGDDCVYYQVSFSVTEAYQGDDSYTTDASKTGAASAAAANAEAVVAKYEKESDYHKLLAYQNWICEAVSYDHSAASSGSYALNNNPWQLIYVFDGNADTNVVCEGYAKAFMYLCDLSDFTGDVTCVTVSGNAGGAHMWNIVALNDENYLVDVTNSDAGSIGQNGDLFLVGTSGSILDGYTFLGVHYSYDNDTRKLWGAADDSILKLAEEDYVKELVEEDTIPEGLVYEVVDNAVKITDYTGTASDLVIPATIEGYPVIAIGSEAFSRCDSLVSVTVPESITAIYMQAFAYCSKLEEITLPDTLTKLGALAFYECVNLTKVNLPANLTEIQKSVFCGCSSLNSIIVPSGVTQILDGAFMYSGLDYVVIPATVESIGKLAFENTNLWHILYEGTQAQWNSISADVQDELSNATIHCNISSNQIIEVNTLNCQGKVLHHCQVCDERFYDSAYTGKVGDHEYVGYVTEPSCTAKGYTTYICHCGEQYVDDYVDMLDHEFGSWYVENDPTCTENGNERRDCDDCDAFETRVIKANGHQYSHSVTKPTCTEEGYTTHTCDICGYAYADTYVDFLGHTGGKATCKDKAICTRCEKPYGELDGSNHAGGTEIRNAKDATCSLNGYTGDTHCKGCSVKTASGESISFTGHSFGQWYTENAPGCTEKGKDRRDCNHCDHYETRVTSATGHLYEHVVTPPACMDDGYTTHTCRVCGYAYADSYISCLGHTGGTANCKDPAVCDRCAKPYGETDLSNHAGGTEVKNARTATCTEPGYTGDIHCAGCGKRLHYGSQIASTGHSYIHTITQPNCTEVGYTTHVCVSCGHTYADTYVNALGHTGGTATCKDRAVCASCETPYGQTNPSSHVGGTEVRNIKIATCTEIGYTGDTYCKGCDAKISTGETIRVKGHTEVTITGKAATCTESGLTEGKKCTVCGVVTVKQEIVQAKGHTYTSEVVAPTYTEKGYTEHTCSACGHSYKDSYRDVLVLPKKISIKASTSSKTGKPVVSWTKLEGEVTYKVYRATSSKGKYYLKGTVTGDSFEDTSASVGKKYYYKVKASAGGKTTDYSSYKSATCKLAAPVISASVSKYSGKVKISWKKVSSAKKYEVYRATSTGSFKKLTTTTSTSYTDSSASVGTNYRYRVKAIASKSTYNSAYSEILTAKRICAQPDLEVKISTTYGKPSLSWDKVSGAKSYNIYRAESQYDEYTLVRTATSTSWTDKTAAFDKDYWYQVDVVGSKTGTDNDTDAAVKVHTTCAKPSVSITISSKKPMISWKPVEGATKYYVYRATSKSGKYTKVATVTDVTSYRDSKAKKGKTYYYKVKAIADNSAANSAYSSVKSIKSK